MLQTGRSPVRIPDEVDFVNLPNISSRTLAPGSTQPLIEMCTRNLPGGKKRPALRADNFAAVCELNVGASTSRSPKDLHGLYRDSFTYIYYINILRHPENYRNMILQTASVV
jgi:hypothetical protein